jgi:hypothetical protein
MRRTLLLLLALLLVTVTALSVLVNLRSEGSEPLPEPDPSMPILMADGSELPLSEVLDRVARNVPLPDPPPAEAAAASPEPAATATELRPPRRFELEWSQLTDEQRQTARARFRESMTKLMTENYGPVFGLAYQHEHEGHDDQAIALYLSIKEGEPGYAYSRRRVGWHILTKRKGQAARGVRYVQQALIADPLNGNSWQDFGRIYARTLGIPAR